MRRGTPRSRYALIVLLAVSLALIVLDARDGSDPVTSGARSAGAMVFSPVSAGASVVTAPVSAAYRTLISAPGARERIEEVQARNSELAARLKARERDDSRSRQLEELLHLSGLGRYEIVAAQAVTQLTPQGYSDTVTLDVGTRDGVRTDMTVVNGDGLVGRVLEVGATTATVLLVTDGASSVGVRLADSSEIGVANGTSHTIDGGAPISLELLDPDARVGKGDRIVTLGSHDQAPFVPGVPVGTVAKVQDAPGALTRTARVEPAADIGSLDVVGVVVAGPEEDPRDSVLPPEPGEEDRADASRAPARHEWGTT